MRNVLITGTTTGIGLAAARHLHRLGWQVFAGVLPGEDTTALTDGIAERLHVIPMDITDSGLVQEAAQVIERHTGDAGLHGLVNNAGIAVSGPMEYLPVDAIRQQMDVNFIGHVQVTQTMLPLIRKATGRVVNISSIFGRLVVPFSGPYCASKYALEAFTDALRLELAPWGIHVIAIEPTIIDTPIWAKQQDWRERMSGDLPPAAAEHYGERLQALKQTTRNQVAIAAPVNVVSAAIEHALTARRPRTRYLVGTDSTLARFVVRFLPDRLRDRMLLWRLKMD